MYPVHGAAVAFFRGKFWVFGGSTGNDNYDHTITDKVGLQIFKSLVDGSSRTYIKKCKESILVHNPVGPPCIWIVKKALQN